MDDFSLIIFLFFVFFIAICTFIKRVPPGTTIIIDRNTHFHKKKKHGYYFFNPKTDKITTMISKHSIVQNYTNIFKTHDDVYYTLTFSTTYNAVDVDNVLSSLEDSRRSIYDIINCSIQTTVASYTSKELDLLSYNRYSPNPQIINTFSKQLESMLEPFYIDVTKFYIYNCNKVSEAFGKQNVFNRHISSGYNPLGSSSYNGNPIGGGSSNSDDPFGRL